MLPMYLIVLDFNTGMAIQYTITPEHQAMDADELLTALGHREKDCHWMFGSEPIEERDAADYDDGIREI